MAINKKAMLHWCDSVEETWHPREQFTKDSFRIPEQFLAAAIRYLRAACAELPDSVEEKSLDKI